MAITRALNVSLSEETSIKRSNFYDNSTTSTSPRFERRIGAALASNALQVNAFHLIKDRNSKVINDHNTKMITDSNPNKKSRTAKNEDPKTFKVLEGTLKSSDYAKFHLLVPENSVEELAEALSKAESSLYVWTIGDEEITDIQNIPSNFAHPIRSIGEIPKDKSESELLDWLIHGESFFSKKYAILKFVDGKSGDESPYSGNVAYEIENSEHFKKFVKALEEIFDFSEEERYDRGEEVYLDRYYIIDRGQYLGRHDFSDRRVVDDATVEAFEAMAKKRDPLCMHDYELNQWQIKWRKARS